MGHTMSFRFHFQKLFRNFSSSSSANTSTIGIVKRYEQFQKEFPEHLILIQVGDFYEIYGNAVEDAAKVLEIAVTRTPGKPSSATNSSTNTPMTGFPVRSFDTFLKKLIKAGVSVVVADQVPIPDSARFDRKVSRIITPGTVLEESLLDRNLNNFILFLDQNESSSKKDITCAWMDISTGDFFTGSCANETELVNLLSRLKPREIVAESPVSSSYFLLSEFLKHDSILFRLVPPNNARKFDLDFAVEPGLSSKELDVSRKLLQHIKNSLRGAISSIAFKPLSRFAPGQKYLEIDADSFRSLDILSNSSSSASPTATLFHTLNECKTALGSRLLARRLQAPLLDPVEINEALNRVEKFLACGKDSVKALQRKLGQIGDIERVLQRLCLRRPQGVARDLKSLAKFLISSQEAIEEFFNHEQDRQNAPSRGLNSKLLEHLSLIIRVLNQEKLPLRDADGNLFISGWNSELDDLRRLRDDSVSVFSDLAASYRQSTGIPNLKVISFKSEQYVVEVPKAAGPLNSESN
jgi:DNA mismatch repair protein MutS